MIRPLLIAAVAATPLPALAQDADTVLATVGETEITLGNVISLRSRLPGQYQGIEDEALYAGILDQLITQEVLAQVIEADLTRADNLTLENERRAVLASRHIERLNARPISEEDIQAAYEEQYGGVEPETEWNAAHILVATEDEARALVAQLNDGADFAQLAREKSTGPSGPNGGSLGWFSAGQMVPEFEETVKGLEAGDVSEPVETQFGWHVVKLNETRLKEAPPLEQVRPQIEAELADEALGAEIQRLMEAAGVERATIEVDPALIRDDSLIE